MHLSLRQLRYLVAAAEAGNVTEAARRLNVSQPSISAAIAEVEALVGVPLFVRRYARGVTMTPAGRRIVSDAIELLKHASDFRQNAVGLSAQLRGDISIGCFHTLAERFMPQLLATFTRRYPGISVTLHEGDQDELLTMLLAGQIETVLGFSFHISDQIETQILAELPPHIVVSARHQFARRRRVSLKDFASEPFILLDLPKSREYFLQLFHSVGVEPRVVFRSRSPELIRGLAANGHGYTLQNSIPATTTACDGSRIAVLPLSEKLTPARIMIARLKRHSTRPAVQAFEGHMRGAFSRGGTFAPGSIRPPVNRQPKA
jgi:DNA-binding transcriptional LysR family regulator